MTNVAVWYVPKVDQVWAVADARVGGGESKYTDQAAKILPLRIRTHSPASAHGGWKPVYENSVGFCYAGSTLAALLSHAALNVFLQNLGSETGSAPSLERVANLCAYVSSHYLQEIRAANSTSAAEYIVFGMCPETKKFRVYHVGGPTVSNGKLAHPVNEITVLSGHVAVLGTKKAELVKRIDELRVTKNLRVHQLEPRFAIEERVIKGEPEGVGGTLQFAIAEHDDFRIYATTFDGKSGGGAMQYLGFNLSTEIEPKIGSFIKMTALL